MIVILNPIACQFKLKLRWQQGNRICTALWIRIDRFVGFFLN